MKDLDSTLILSDSPLLSTILQHCCFIIHRLKLHYGFFPFSPSLSIQSIVLPVDRLIHLERTVCVLCHSTRKKTTIYASLNAGIFLKSIASLLCRALIPRPLFNTSTESIESSINSHWSFTTFLLYCLQFLVPAQRQRRCVFPTTTQTLMIRSFISNK